MKTRHVVRFAIFVLAGCASVLHASEANSANETVIYSFKGLVTNDGVSPIARLAAVKGKLYGTTVSGGVENEGTVFSVSPTGTEKVLHSFVGISDGAGPQSALIEVNGILYGTTSGGGSYPGGVGGGTFYSITRGGTEKVLYAFGKGSDGFQPLGDLMQYKGALYGTTSSGGTQSCNAIGTCGTVFFVTLGGAEKVLYSFKGGGDGLFPFAGLVNAKGTFYGTTVGGAGTGCSQSLGCGTVFSITPSGTENVLSGFAGCSDGNPTAGLINVRGTLYGTSSGCATGPGCGTVFSITPSGTRTVLHTFTKSSDGNSPRAALTDVNGLLYGTTYAGGAYGLGTVFSITRRGSEKVLYSFKGNGDGANPQAALIDVNGTLYGTTTAGGAGSCYGGCGTVFAITP